MEGTKTIFDPELIRRYDKAGPRYTSYPTAAQFHSGFGEARYREAAAQSNTEHPKRPLSLYFHLPFCDTICFYCACNKIVTKNRARAVPYLESLMQEIARQGEIFDRDRVVEQLHWGGGTPTFISHEEMRSLMEATRRYFTLHEDDGGEYSIEIDPREIKSGTLALLRELGFNRLSMGVQDFEPAVQWAVNRIQSEQVTLDVLHEARALRFHSVSMDLIYGLPRQTLESFARTLDRIIAAAPDRLSVFNYAHLPEMFKTQRQIAAAELPDPRTKLDILQLTIERLTGAGYVYIGIDHFARPDDELARAQRQGTLYRNFQGYSTHADCDLIGMGISAIGMVGPTYGQNYRTIPEYSSALAAGKLPLWRGVVLSDDDRLRRAVIGTLICNFRLDVTEAEQRFGIRFGDYFATELAELDVMQRDGLLRLEPGVITVCPPGKLLIRSICMVFDKYLRAAQSAWYSRVI